MGLVGAGVSAASRTLGHWISLGITGIMMGLVIGFIFTKSKLRAQLPGASWWHIYGPTVLVAVASLFIMAEPVRHIMQDVGAWKECGDNDAFPRVNQTWNDGCTWSSSQYHCDKLCYVPGTWTGSCGDDGEGCAGDINLHDYLDDKGIEDLLASDVDDMCHCTDDESWANLSTVGWIFTFTLTYLGFIVLTSGVMWNADIVKKFQKIRSQYRALRDPEYRRKLKQEAMGELPMVRSLIAKHPVVMFSKTTCPFCFKAKEALNKELSAGSYHVLELDLVENGSAIQDALKAVTGGRTVPRVFIGGEFIGGGDDTVEKQATGELRELLAKAGVI